MFLRSTMRKAATPDRRRSARSRETLEELDD
jgi:hypothetical protein